MNTLTKVKNFSDYLVFCYSKFDLLSDRYNLSINEIPEFDLHNMSALLIQEDDSLASESIGLDNPSYQNKMLPALISLLKQSHEKEKQREFIEEWIGGVNSYHTKAIEDLIEESLEKYNQDKGYVRGDNSWAA